MAVAHRRAVLWLVVTLALSWPCHAVPTRLTVFHTNDWHSRFLPFGEAPSVGGLARRATVLAQRRAVRQAEGPVVVVDAGDCMMGSIFHTLCTSEAFELSSMGALGYDAVALGNHDFDYGPEALAEVVAVARRKGPVPVVLSANLIFSAHDARDDALAALVVPRTVIERGGLRIGLFGLIGRHAVDVTKSAGPVTFADARAAAAEQVAALRGAGRADVVIALSHSGIWPDGRRGWSFEDVELARAVPGLDVIVSGHTHQVTETPVLVGRTVVVQAGSFGTRLGELVIEPGTGGLRVVDYRLHHIDDTVPADPWWTAEVARMGRLVDERIMRPHGMACDEVIVTTDRDLGRGEDEHTLANLVTDAIRLAAGTDIAFTGNGTIRDDLLRGRRTTADVFRVTPLGRGLADGGPGYPLVKAWLTGPELKAVVEVFLLAHTFKGPPYFPRVSGVRIRYHPWRIPFDRVCDIQVGDDEQGWRSIDLSGADGRRWSFACTTYVGRFIWAMGTVSFGLLEAHPTFSDGRPVATPEAAILDGHEVKVWQALVRHLRTLPDRDGDGVADVPARGAAVEANRIVAVQGMAPADLVANLTWITAAAGAAAGLLVSLPLAWYVRRRRRRRREEP